MPKGVVGFHVGIELNGRSNLYVWQHGQGELSKRANLGVPSIDRCRHCEYRSYICLVSVEEMGILGIVDHIYSGVRCQFADRSQFCPSTIWLIGYSDTLWGIANWREEQGVATIELAPNPARSSPAGCGQRPCRAALCPGHVGVILRPLLFQDHLLFGTAVPLDKKRCTATERGAAGRRPQRQGKRLRRSGEAANTNDSRQFTHDCATLLGWLLASDLPDDEISRLWRQMLG